MTPKQMGKWFGMIVVALGVIWMIVSLVTTKSFESIGIGLIILIIGVGILVIFRRLV